MDYVIVIVTLTYALCSGVVVGDAVEYSLLRDLMRNYDPRIRPSLNSSDPLNVTFGLALAQIIDVDEKNQIITTNCWLNQMWIDYKLRWDPKSYGGVKVTRIPFDSIWRPDILLYNNADVSSYRSSISTNVIVTSDGNVTWLSMVIFRSSCAIDVKFFPFDEQNCSLLFASWTYDGYQLNLDKIGEEGDTSNYIPNNEWTLIRLHARRNVVFYSCCAEPYPDVTYTIQMRRKPLFYAFNMILPCLLITLVALLGFYIPSDSGEKIAMGITTLLSMTVFLMLVAENMPPTSDVLPLVGLYYGITISIVSMATAMTVLTLNIHHRGLRGRPVPKVVRRVCLNWLARLLCLRFQTNAATIEPYVSRLRPEDPVFSRSRNLFRRSGCSRSCSTATTSGPSIRSPSGHMTTADDNSYTDFTIIDFSPVKESDDCDRISAFEPLSLRRTTALSTSTAASSSTPLPRSAVLTPPPAPPAREEDSPAAASDRLEAQLRGAFAAFGSCLEASERRLEDKERRDVIRLEWQQVALVVDRVLMVVFVVITIGVTLGVLLHAPHSLEFLLGREPEGIERKRHGATSGGDGTSNNNATTN